MTAGTVLVLPSPDAGLVSARSELLDRVRGSLDVDPLPGPAAALAARICGSINGADPRGPLHVVAFGPSALLLPAVALAQRAARRRVAEYVLVDPDIPVVSDSWPDAPVTVYAGDRSSPAAVHARLRGWLVLPLPSLAEWIPAGG